jgi:HEPN domain
MPPDTAEDWMAVATERGADAEALLNRRNLSVGCVYMAGYAVECSLKAYLQSRGIPLPSRGQAGHDLRALWRQSGFQLADLRDTNGTKTFFVETWATDLRYETGLDINMEFADLLQGAKALSGWIQTRSRRARRRR